MALSGGRGQVDTKWSKILSGINIPLSVIMPLSATTRH